MTQDQSTPALSHQLLEHALEALPSPQGDVIGSVLAEARIRRTRRRTRRAVGSVALILAATGLVATVGPFGPGKQSDTVAASQVADYPVNKLMPHDVTNLHRLTGKPNASAIQGGVFTFTRHGQQGYLVFTSYDKPRAPIGEHFTIVASTCSQILPVNFAHGLTCTMIQLPHGAQECLTTQVATGEKGYTTPPWDGPSNIAVVTYPDGRQLAVKVMSSFQSPTKVTRPPLLTLAEVSAMATSPDWFPPTP